MPSTPTPETEQQRAERIERIRAERRSHPHTVCAAHNPDGTYTARIECPRPTAHCEALESCPACAGQVPPAPDTQTLQIHGQQHTWLPHPEEWGVPTGRCWATDPQHHDTLADYAARWRLASGRHEVSVQVEEDGTLDLVALHITVRSADPELTST
jgi:hypothetical protein